MQGTALTSHLDAFSRGREAPRSAAERLLLVVPPLPGSLLLCCSPEKERSKLQGLRNCFSLAESKWQSFPLNIFSRFL